MFGFRQRKNEITKRRLHESDLFFSTDGGHDAEWKQLGVNHITLRQGISADEHVWVKKRTAIPEIVFVGSNYYSQRRKLIAFLRQRYNQRFRVINHTFGLRLNAAVQSAKIVVGDSYPSPHYWSNRVYEMIGRGGFLIHPEVEGLEKEFAPDKEIVLFRYGDFDDLAAKIKKYLNDDRAREAIRANGFAKCPTYDDRVAVLLSHVDAWKPAD